MTNFSYLTYSNHLSTFKNFKEKDYKDIYKMIGIIINCTWENLQLPGFVEDEVESFVKNLIPNGYKLDDNILSSFDIVITPQTLLRTFCQQCPRDTDNQFGFVDDILFSNTSINNSIFIMIMKKFCHVTTTHLKLHYIQNFVATLISFRN